jgi:hypothetical protein
VVTKITDGCDAGIRESAGAGGILSKLTVFQAVAAKLYREA